jgi:uncharacterized SAM-binding protein YcdF (DUF218 family)
MFLFLSKFLPPFIYPLGIAILLIGVAILIYRHHRLRTVILVITLLLLLIASNRWVAYALTRSLEWQYLPTGEIPEAKVIVLLGGGTDSAEPPRPMVQINGAGQRVIYAAFLYKHAKAPYILASGGNVVFFGAQASTPAQDMASLLQFMGVPDQSIWLETQSQNTHENAVDCAKILKKSGITKIILVTSAIHMPRSVALFQKQGLTVIPAPADFAVTQTNWADLTQAPFAAQLINLLPSSSYMSMTNNALKEYIGILTYRMNGWE